MGVYQQFYDHWRDSPSKFRDTSTTYTLSLMDPDIESKLSISPKHTTGNKILVTRAYEDMHHRLLRLRGNDKGRTQGVVITGQPGIGGSIITRSAPPATSHRCMSAPGKTTFLGFMLARLISAKQIVVLCNSTKVLLFYCGRVYSQEASLGFRGLPINQHNAQYCPIWALVDSRKGGPNIIRSSNIWPIQTSSPNPDRWKEWRKQNGAVVLGMPLWDTDDLVKG